LPQQALMLQVADAALRDGGRLGRPSASSAEERTGVFIGMELDCNTANFHFRWSLPEPLRETAGPALSANRTMGALGGIIASRIAREFKAGGPSFTIASDETSGLRALEAAASALRRGELDCALVGAVDLAGDPRSLAARNALRPYAKSGRVRPFDESADGGAPGEGAAAVVLKRLDDALRDGDRVYAVLRGTGAASAKEAQAAEGYALALERAYEDAGLRPQTVEFVETHGSGSPAEDAAEARALAAFFADRSPRRRLALGSVKPVIGHTGAASGLASFVKAALALYQEVLPPLEVSEARAEFDGVADRFHAPRAPQYWLRNRAEGPRRAGVSAMGLGGNFAHAVLEQLDSVPPNCERPAERRQPLGARAEGLFVIEADSAPELILAARRLRSWLDEVRPMGVEALARAWWGQAPALGRKAHAVSFVARDAAELRAQALGVEKSLLEDPASPVQGLDRVFYSPEPLGRLGRTAFVFPGSGNQYIGMGLGAAAQWPEVFRALDGEVGRLKDQFVPELFAPWRLSWPEGWQDAALETLAQDHKSMIIGQVSHGAAVSDLVRSFGVEPSAAIGYSLGESAALVATRAWKDRDEMLRRIEDSPLFVSELAGPCNAARRSWGLAAHEAVDWVLGVVDRPEKLVRATTDKMEKVEAGARHHRQDGEGLPPHRQHPQGVRGRRGPPRGQEARRGGGGDLPAPARSHDAALRRGARGRGCLPGPEPPADDGPRRRAGLQRRLGAALRRHQRERGRRRHRPGLERGRLPRRHHAGLRRRRPPLPRDGAPQHLLAHGGEDPRRQAPCRALRLRARPGRRLHPPAPARHAGRRTRPGGPRAPLRRGLRGRRPSSRRGRQGQRRPHRGPASANRPARASGAEGPGP
ncbi:MAG: type I polyketide synthase, partial [Elusimicrobia bacterium]|nr:type I polyketide synthase [Elusimicrobiota bacterium]